MKPGARRDRAEFVVQLNQQLTWLDRSAAGYDAGETDEALRMSAHLRTILHDYGSRTVSLLTHLGVKKTVGYLSTATPQSPTSGFWAGITKQRIGENLEYVDYVPKLGEDSIARHLPYRDWWEREIVYAAKGAGLAVVRRDLILWAAQKDGGVHVDEIVPETYRWLQEGAGWSITVYPNNAPPRTMKFANAHLSALRQIAYEDLNTPDLRQIS